MATNFRNLFTFMVPSWLQEGDGGKVLHSLALVKDVFLASLRQGFESRFPTRAGDTALNEYLAPDRGLIRGRTETREHFAARLVRWRYPRGHRVRGSAFALLDQVFEFFGGIRCWTIDARGNLHLRGASDMASTTYAPTAEHFEYGYAWDWDGQPATPNWGRFWVVLTPSPQLPEFKAHPVIGDPDLYGGAIGNPGYTVGQLGVTPDDVITIRRLFKGTHKWKPAGTLQQTAVIQLGDWTSTSPPAPDGTWGDWYGRDPALRYWNLNQ